MFELHAWLSNSNYLKRVTKLLWSHRDMCNVNIMYENRVQFEFNIRVLLFTLETILCKIYGQYLNLSSYQKNFWQKKSYTDMLQSTRRIQWPTVFTEKFNLDAIGTVNLNFEITDLNWLALSAKIFMVSTNTSSCPKFSPLTYTSKRWLVLVTEQHKVFWQKKSPISCKQQCYSTFRVLHQMLRVTH